MNENTSAKGRKRIGEKLQFNLIKINPIDLQFRFAHCIAHHDTTNEEGRERIWWKGRIFHVLNFNWCINPSYFTAFWWGRKQIPVNSSNNKAKYTDRFDDDNSSSTNNGVLWKNWKFSIWNCPVESPSKAREKKGEPKWCERVVNSKIR